MPNTPADAPKGIARLDFPIGVIGTGRMGLQLASLVARQINAPVTLYARNSSRLTEYVDLPDAAADSITVTSDLNELKNCQVVIEAVTENLAIKRRVFFEVENVVSANALLVTTTSSLRVTDVGAELNHPQRLVGMHFFNPVARMRLVEVIPSRQTVITALDAALQLAADLGKTAVVVRDSPGFVVNRLLMLVLAVAQSALANGASPDAVAAAMAQLGLPLTLSQLAALIGPSTLSQVQTSLAAQLGERYRPDQPIGDPRSDVGELADQMAIAIDNEIQLMLAERVVPDRQQIRKCLLLGAGWRLP